MRQVRLVTERYPVLVSRFRKEWHFDPDQPRGQHGEWTAGAAVGSAIHAIEHGYRHSDAPHAERVYQAEQSVRNKLGPGEVFANEFNGHPHVDDADDYANEVWQRNSDLWRGHGDIPKRVEVRQGRSAASSGLHYVADGPHVRPVVELGSQMMDQLTTLHELAHALHGPKTQAEIGHSEPFQRTFQTLLRREMPDHAKELSRGLASP